VTARFQVEVEHDPESWISAQCVKRDTDYSDMRGFIKKKLNDLPVPQREVIEFTFYKGMSQREIAALTGIPLSTVKTRIELGLRKLSSSLQTLAREL
jgi:RNA polymerase sigma-70 factor (ECF subfamily)